MDANISYYNRRACQRCHAQKLSCRPETETKCVRCSKANADCVPRSSLRTRKTENFRRSHSNHRISMDSEISDLQSRPTTDLSSEPLEFELTGIANNGNDNDAGDGAESTSDHQNEYLTAVSASDWISDIAMSNLGFAGTTPGIAAISIGTGSGPTMEHYTTYQALTQSNGMVFNSPNTHFTSLLELPRQDLPPADIGISIPEGMLSASGTEPESFCSTNWVEKLAKLSSKISKQSQTMYKDIENSYEVEDPGSSSRPAENMSPANCGTFFDDIFTLTKELIELLDKLRSPDNKTYPCDTAEFSKLNGPNIFQNVNLDGSFQDTESSNLQDTGVPNATKQSGFHECIRDDPFAIILFMSCYIRLVESYKLILTRVHTIVAEQGPQAIRQLLPHSQFPTTIVGPFSLRAGPNLEILLVVELVNSVIGHIGCVAGRFAPQVTSSSTSKTRQHGELVSSPGSNPLDHTISSTFEAVREQEKELRDAIFDIRGELTQRGTETDVGLFFSI